MQKHRRIVTAISIIYLLAQCGGAMAEPSVGFKKIQLSGDFYAEGAGIGDFNQDGQNDAVYGPFWYEGPEFKKRHLIYEAKTFDPNNYSNNFITFVHDVNGDGWHDVLVNVWPGEEVAWFENPQGEAAEAGWKRHLAFPVVDNESPQYGDLTGDGEPELVFHTEGRLGFAQPSDDTAEQRWHFKICSAPENWQRYTHGLGFGDVNGDGRTDFLMASGWWEQPEGDGEWTKHPFAFGAGGAQMHTYDVDDDGDQDVITSLQAHGYGLAWFEQVQEDGKIDFRKHEILPSDPSQSLDGVQFSQLHAVELTDVDRDGLVDIVTGKRHWAHGPKGDPDPMGAAVLYWFKLHREQGDDGATVIKYTAHQIDNDSGVGTQFSVGDLNGDGKVDIVTGNKRGGYVFLQQ